MAKFVNRTKELCGFNHYLFYTIAYKRHLFSAY